MSQQIDVELEIKSTVVEVELTGVPGAVGPAGPAGVGVPSGGTIRQFLGKASSADYDNGWFSLIKSDVGLSNVDNTSDLSKPISTATQTALNLKANISNLATVAFTGSYTDLTGRPTIPTVAGSEGQVQFNSSGSLGADNTFTYDNTNKALILGTGTPFNATVNLQIGGSGNTTVQANVMNTSNGGSASSDWVATADTGSDSSNYVNMGINSSGYNNASYTITGALDSYLYSNGGNLAIGTQTSAKQIVFHTGGTLAANERARITDIGLGLATTAPTHSLTVASSGTGIALYNTSDQVTNYERAILSWSGNALNLKLSTGGTGNASRGINIGTVNRNFQISDGVSTSGYFQFNSTIGGTPASQFAIAGVQGTFSNSSGIATSLVVNPTINQSVTAGYTAMLVNVTETATGSGTKRLLDLQVGGTSYLNVDNRGTLNAIGPAGTSPTNSLINLAPNNSTTGNYLLNFNIDRAWGFRQLSTGATTSLELHAQTDAKQFLITSLGSTQAGTIDFSLNDSGSFIGIGNNPSVLPTHSLTLGSTATGIALYNTSDQTTNYERGILSWQSSQLVLTTASGGTGTIRPLVIGTVNRRVTFTEAYTTTAGVMNFQGSTTSLSGGILAQFQGTSTNSAGVYYGLVVAPIINQSSAGGYTALQVNATETATGSGAKLLADFQVGGVSKWKVRNDGVQFPVQAPTASAPTYALGGVYFDTTLNKLRIGGASGWETVTSI